ncbi:MAG: DUF4215 domain-containing protein [Deltaproteobacteria bacterium]|nr:DUF4215 domain-containing protein [Deltaproteobacteria bacterium]
MRTARLPLLLLALSACNRDFALPGGGEPACGNTTLDPGEGCEDGNLSINDACPSGPQGTCQEAFCGDGFAWVDGFGAAEECDDGNDLPGDGCFQCQVEPDWVCGYQEPMSGCWCRAGYQDHDRDGSCLPGCDNIALPPLEPHEVCDDSSGQVARACALDAEVEPLDGLCELVACDPACGVHQDCDGSQCVCRPSWTGTDCGTCRVMVDPAATCTGCDGESWAGALPSIDAGIALAAKRAAGYGQHCEVWVRAGHYWVYDDHPTDTIALRPWVALYGGFAGTEQTRAERDWRTNRTILDGHAGPDSAEQVWHVVTATSNSTLDGFVVTGGRAEGRFGDYEIVDDDGGGFLAVGAQNVRVANTAFVSNSARTEGGGARIHESSVVFEDCSFVANETWNDVQWNRCAALMSNWSATELRRTVVAGNEAAEQTLCFANAASHDSNLVANNLPTAYGGILWNRGNLSRVYGSVLADHEPGSDLWCNTAAGVIEVEASLFEGFGCGGQGTCALGAGVVDAAPGFVTVPGTASGAWDEVSWDPQVVETTLTDADAGWTAGEHAGRFVQADTATVHQFPILANSATTLTVLGDLRPFVLAGASYQLFDYRLDATSAALDIGMDLTAYGVSTDLLGAARNVCQSGTAPDCWDAGAYERP